MEPIPQVAESQPIWREKSLLICFLYVSLKTLVKSSPDDYLSFKVLGKRAPLFSSGAPLESLSPFQNLLFVSLYPEEKERYFRRIDTTPWTQFCLGAVRKPEMPTDISWSLCSMNPVFPGYSNSHLKQLQLNYI